MKIRFYNLLSWLSKKTKTDMVYIAERGFWVLASQVGSALSALVVTVVLANILSQEAFGQYRFVLAVIPIIAIFTLPGIGTSMIRSVAKGKKVSFSKIVKAKISYGLLSSLASLLFSAYYLYASNQLLAYAFLVTAIFIPFYETFFIYSFYYKGKQDFKKSAIYESISRIFQAILLVSVVFFSKNIILLIAVFFVGKLLSSLFFYFKTKKDEAENISLGKAGDADDDTISYGKHLSLIGILGLITSNIDKLFIWHFIGDKELAIYFIALVLPLNIVLVFNVLSRIAFPKFSQNDWEPKRYQNLLKRLGVYGLILLIPTAMYAAFSPWLIPFLFRSYSGSITAATLLSLLIIFSPLNAIIAQVLRAVKEIRQIVLLKSLVIFSFVIAFLFSYQSFGILAGAFALLASEFVILIAGTLLLRKKSKPA